MARPSAAPQYLPPLPAAVPRGSGATAALGRALERLVTRFGLMVRTVGDRHGLAGQELDDLVQETRIRLWRTMCRDADGARGAQEIPSSYVYRAALCAAVDMVRRRQGRREEPLEGTAAPHAAPSGDDPGDRLARRELLGEIERAVASLPPNRAPVVRMYLAGWTREEIADLLGWSEAKTRNLLYRGLGDLRARLRARGCAPAGDHGEGRA